MKISSKFQVLISGIIAGISGFIGWLAAIPPEQQSGILAQLVELTPVQNRPIVGLVTKIIAFAFGLHSLYKAAQSGPQTPPKNPPV